MSGATQPVVVAAVRTPQVATDGVFTDIYPEDLVTTVLDALVDRSGVPPHDWAGFRLGCANQEDEQGRNLARQALLASGFPETVSAATTNRLCGSSLTCLNDAARAIEAGDGDIYAVAGVEHMTRVPFSEWLHPDIEDRYDPDRLQMGDTAETVARRHDITRSAQDAFALRSHERAVDAWETGRFAEEVVTVDTPEGTITEDDGPRPDTDREALADLPTVFRDDEAATVTPGNAAPLTDGAAGLLVTSAAEADRRNLEILATIESRASVGVDPTVMGTGPVPATRAVLDDASITVDDLDLVELNEAFAAQALYCQHALDIPDDVLNVNGGAIALGHPLGCSGARITTTLLHELRRRDADHGLATMCVGFGQGVATQFHRR